MAKERNIYHVESILRELGIDVLCIECEKERSADRTERTILEVYYDKTTSIEGVHTVEDSINDMIGILGFDEKTLIRFIDISDVKLRYPILEIIKQYGPITAEDISQLMPVGFCNEFLNDYKTVKSLLDELRKWKYIVWTGACGYALTRKALKIIGAERSRGSLDIKRALRLSRAGAAGSREDG